MAIALYTDDELIEALKSGMKVQEFAELHNLDVRGVFRRKAKLIKKGWCVYVKKKLRTTCFIVQRNGIVKRTG